MALGRTIVQLVSIESHYIATWFYYISKTKKINLQLKKSISRVTQLENLNIAKDTYIFLDGESEIVFSSGGDDLLDWTKSWALGLDIVCVPLWEADNSKMNIFSSGAAISA